MLSSINTKENSTDHNLDLIFRALGDKTRRELLSRLSEGSVMVTDLAKPFDMSLPAVGKHLRVLEKAGLVERAVNGRVHLCSLNALPLKDANEWLTYYQKFWGETLDSLTDYIAKESD